MLRQQALLLLTHAVWAFRLCCQQLSSLASSPSIHQSTTSTWTHRRCSASSSSSLRSELFNTIRAVCKCVEQRPFNLRDHINALAPKLRFINITASNQQVRACTGMLEWIRPSSLAGNRCNRVEKSSRSIFMEHVCRRGDLAALNRRRGPGLMSGCAVVNWVVSAASRVEWY